MFDILPETSNIPDLATLNILDPPIILHNLKNRFNNDQIYVCFIYFYLYILPLIALQHIKHTQTHDRQK